MYASRSSHAIPPRKLDARRLLVPPFFINRLPWSRGYFQFVENRALQPDDIRPVHCFHHPLRRQFVDEHGQPIHVKGHTAGVYGVGSYRTADLKISYALGLPLDADEDPSQSNARDAARPDHSKRRPTRGPMPPDAAVDARVRRLADWRGSVLTRLRALVVAAEPRAREQVRRGILQWIRGNDFLCCAEARESVVKVTFARGRPLPDPTGLLRPTADGAPGFDFEIASEHELQATAFKDLVRAAVRRSLQAERATRRFYRNYQRVEPEQLLPGPTFPAVVRSTLPQPHKKR